MLGGLLFLWDATRGNRFRPWRSSYLRWRLETYTGQKADTVGLGDFWRLAVKEKFQIIRFMRWAGRLNRYAATGKGL